MGIKKIRTIDIMGVKHKIRYLPLEVGGYYSPSDALIELDNATKDKIQYLRDLIHESLHGVYYHTGIHQDITLSQEHTIIDSTISFIFQNFDIDLKKR